MGNLCYLVQPRKKKKTKNIEVAKTVTDKSRWCRLFQDYQLNKIITTTIGSNDCQDTIENAKNVETRSK